MSEPTQTPPTLCANCHQRPAHARWGGTLDSMNVARMLNTLPWWCERCMLEAQIRHMTTEVARMRVELPKCRERYRVVIAQEKARLTRKRRHRKPSTHIFVPIEDNTSKCDLCGHGHAGHQPIRL